MSWKTTFLAAGLSAVALGGGPALGADHLDGAEVKKDAATDINDVYTWMSADGKTVYLVMTVFPAATSAAKFSDKAWYTFHTASRSAFASMQPTIADVTCGFDTAAKQNISCWVGSDRNNFVYGDASATAGITSKDGKIRVYAGLRKDHFFFNLAGFNEVRKVVKGAAGGLTFDQAGCPTLDMDTANALVTQLRTAPGGGAAVDFFKDLNTLAIVMAVDKTLLDKGGNYLSVWAGTHRK